MAKKDEDQPQKLEQVTVKTGLKQKPDGGWEVALYETHPQHPGGEAFVNDNRPVKVAKTPLVAQKLNEGTLVLASERAEEKK